MVPSGCSQTGALPGAHPWNAYEQQQQQAALALPIDTRKMFSQPSLDEHLSWAGRCTCVSACNLYVWTQFRLQSVRRMISLMNTVGLAIEGRTGPPNTLSGVRGKKRGADHLQSRVGKRDRHAAGYKTQLLHEMELGIGISESSQHWQPNLPES